MEKAFCIFLCILVRLDVRAVPNKSETYYPRVEEWERNLQVIYFSRTKYNIEMEAQEFSRKYYRLHIESNAKNLTYSVSYERAMQ